MLLREMPTNTGNNASIFYHLDVNWAYMSQLRTRLELLKSLIALEEDELIAAQIDHLRPHIDIQPTLANLITLLEQGRYSQSLELVSQLLHTTTGLISADETEYAACRMELKRLEIRLSQHLDQLNELQANVEEFNSRHHTQLGSQLTQILQWQQSLREGDLQLARMPLRRREASIRRKRRELEEELAAMQKALEAETVRLQAEQAYREAEQKRREAEQDAKQYQQELAEQKLKPTLSEEDRQLIKQIYRKAVKLAHPDLAPDADKEQCTQMMVALNQAREQQDLPRLIELLAQLEAGNWGAQSNIFSSLDVLKKRIAALLSELDVVEQNIADLQQSEVGQVLEQYTDLDLYFHAQATALGEFLTQLEAQRQAQQQQLTEAEQELFDIEQGVKVTANSANVEGNFARDSLELESHANASPSRDDDEDLSEKEAEGENNDYWERAF